MSIFNCDVSHRKIGEVMVIRSRFHSLKGAFQHLKVRSKSKAAPLYVLYDL
jgi:hypothetical protein